MPATSLKLSFGVELEYVEKSDNHDELCSQHGFAARLDTSVRRSDGTVGFETVTPVLFANVAMSTQRGIPCVTFDEQPVVDLCRLAKLVNKTCGLHVHVGRPVSGSELRSVWTSAQVHAWMVTGNFLEPALYGLCPNSRTGNTHAKPIGDVYRVADWASDNPAEPVNPSKYNNPKRYCWLNIIETARRGAADVSFDQQGGRGTARGLGTVEIRMLGNTRQSLFTVAWVKLMLQWGAVIATRNPVVAVSEIIYGGALATHIRAVKEAKDTITTANAAQRRGVGVGVGTGFSSNTRTYAPVTPRTAGTGYDDPDGVSSLDDTIPI